MTAEYFDQWYTDMTGSEVLAGAKQRHYGLPPELMSTSALSLEGLRLASALLALKPGETLLDLACGRGGYGLWLARETGVRLVGVDFSEVAIAQAALAVSDFGLDQSRAVFRLGELEATGLPDESVDAVLCVDSIQFATDVVTAARECVRVLRPGGRILLTGWEARDRDNAAVSDRIRRLDLVAQLPAAGFADVTVEERDDWRRLERTFWEEAVARDPGDDPALQSWHSEGVRSLATFEAVRRVLATGARR